MAGTAARRDISTLEDGSGGLGDVQLGRGARK